MSQDFANPSATPPVFENPLRVATCVSFTTATLHWLAEKAPVKMNKRGRPSRQVALRQTFPRHGEIPGLNDYEA